MKASKHATAFRPNLARPRSARSAAARRSRSIAWGFLVAVLCSCASRPVLAVVDTPDALLPETQGSLQEFSVAINPEVPTTVLVAGMYWPAGGGTNEHYIAAFVSTDAGATWKTTPSIANHLDYADPSAAWVKSEGTWIALVSFLAPQDNGLYIARSADLGETWSTSPIYAATPPPDKPWLAVNNLANDPRNGQVYIAWSDHPAGTPRQVHFAKSTDKGVTWSLPQTLSSDLSSGHQFGTNVRVGPGGIVYVAWAIYDGGAVTPETAFGMAKSTDGGETWGTGAWRAIQQVHGHHTVFPPFVEHFSFPCLAVDVSGGLRNGTVYIAWTNLGVPGGGIGDADIYIAKSTNGGATFDVGNAVRVNQVATNTQWSPWLACDPATGALVAIWYDGRVDPADNLTATFCGISTDGGTTWNDFRLGDENFHPIGQLATQMGDYIGVDASGGYVVPVWADCRNGTNALGYTSPFLLDWSGMVTLSSDFLVPSGLSLTILPGTTVRAVSHTDGHNVGNEAGLTEVVVPGKIEALGEAGNPVRFESTGGQAGDWGGILFKDAADMRVSTLYNCDFHDAKVAIEVDSLSGNLVHPTFSSISDKEIWVNRDTRIVEGAMWALDAPCTVRVASGAGVDILVDGALATVGPSQGFGSGKVMFGPASPSGTGADWEGIQVRWGATGQLVDVDVGNARNPIAFLAAGYARVWNSRIHDYAEVGIMDGASTSGLSGNQITGSIGTAQGVIRAGIHLIDSPARVDADTVGAHADYGLWAEFNKNSCATVFTPPETLYVSSCLLTGPGEGSPTFPQARGVYLHWACENRHPRIHGNKIRQWPNIGLDLVSCEGVEATCNTIRNDNYGVHYSRYWGVDTLLVHLANNTMDLCNQRNVWVEEGEGLRLVNGSGVGRNILRMETALAYNLQMDDSGIALAMDATDNNWIPSTGVVCQTVPCAQSTITGVGASRVDVDPLRTDLVTQCSGGSEALAMRAEDALVGDERVPAAAAEDGTLPKAFDLLVRGGIGGGDVEFHCAIPGGYTGGVEITIFDVGGRRVHTLEKPLAAPGRHVLTWVGEDDSGRRVGSGVYFARMTAGEYRTTRKVVWVR